MPPIPHLVLIVAILALAIPLLVILAPVAIVWLIVNGVRGRSPKNKRNEAEETRIMQEIHQGLSGLEERMSNIETIILERERDSERASRE